MTRASDNLLFARFALPQGVIHEVPELVPLLKMLIEGLK